MIVRIVSVLLCDANIQYFGTLTTFASLLSQVIAALLNAVSAPHGIAENKRGIHNVANTCHWETNLEFCRTIPRLLPEFQSGNAATLVPQDISTEHRISHSCELQCYCCIYSLLDRHGSSKLLRRCSNLLI